MGATTPCPDMELLQKYAAGQTSPQENLQLTIHFVKCPFCVRTVDDLKRVATQLLATSPARGQTATDGGSRRSTARTGAAPDSFFEPDAVSQPRPGFFPSIPNVEGAELIGPYRIVKKLGEGGMGQVFQAEDTRLQRSVALKVMNASSAIDPVCRQRFIQEARAAAALKHDHIVTIYQVDECSLPDQDGRVPYLAMEFLEGESLETRLRRERKLPVEETVRIAREVASGLAAAHANGLVHRDIKPGNIWLERRDATGGSSIPRVKLLDFGLVRRAGDTGQNLTQSGFAIGTPAYMSPEQARCTPVDHRCDLFSLGIVMYQMCSSKVPFHGEDPMATMIAIATEQPVPLRQVQPDVPLPLAELIMHLVAKSPDDRPPTAMAVVERLRAFEMQLVAPARQSSRTRPTVPTTIPPRPQAAPQLPPSTGLGWLSGPLLKLGAVVATVVLTFYVGYIIFKDFQKSTDGILDKASKALTPKPKKPTP